MGLLFLFQLRENYDFQVQILILILSLKRSIYLSFLSLGGMHIFFWLEDNHLFKREDWINNLKKRDKKNICCKIKLVVVIYF